MFWQMKAVSETLVLQVTVRPSRFVATSLIFLLVGFGSVVPEKGGAKFTPEERFPETSSCG